MIKFYERYFYKNILAVLFAFLLFACSDSGDSDNYKGGPNKNDKDNKEQLLGSVIDSKAELHSVRDDFKKSLALANKSYLLFDEIYQKLGWADSNNNKRTYQSFMTVYSTMESNISTLINEKYNSTEKLILQQIEKDASVKFLTDLINELKEQIKYYELERKKAFCVFRKTYVIEPNYSKYSKKYPSIEQLSNERILLKQEEETFAEGFNNC